MLQDKNTTIKILTGSYGSGKTFLMVAHALDLIKKGQFDKLIWVRNNIEVKDSNPLGMLPGSAYDKLLPFAGPLIDHVGGIDGLNAFIDNGMIELQHLGYIRGRDIKNSIIISSEAENLTKQHVQLLIGRVGEGSNLWLDGDYRQVDKAIFKENSGLEKAVTRLAGEPLFAYVNLPISERSATARLADKLD
jgi:predicted ribonuclease YlaK